MTPAGSRTRFRRTSPPFLLLTVPVFVLLGALALNLVSGGSAAAETVSFLPSSASCSNSEQTEDTPAACTASASTLIAGGDVAIVESDNIGENQGDDDLQLVFALGGLDASRVTGANLEVGASQSGDAGTIQLGGPTISDTSYGSIPMSGGSTSSPALVSAVTGAAGGSITVWLQFACDGTSNDCGVAVDSVRLNVELKDAAPTVGLVVSGSPDRSGAQALQGAQLDDAAYIFVSPDNGVSQVRFFLDDPARESADTVENLVAFDFAATAGDGRANPWDSTSVAAGAHTLAIEVDFDNGSSTVVSTSFTTGAAAPVPEPVPGSPTFLVSGSSDRSNSVALDGATLENDAYIHVAPTDGISQVRFFLDDPGRNGVDTIERTAPYDFQGTDGSGLAGAWDPASVSDGSHTLSAEIDFANGSTSVISASFSTGGGAAPIDPPASPAPQDLFVSLSSNRSSPAILNGQTFDGKIYVFVLSGEGVQQARFWVDDRDRNGSADRVENLFPYDLAGGSATQAGSFDAGGLSEGTHWITTELDIVGGGTTVVEGSFKVPGGSTSGGTPTSIPGDAVRINPGQSIQSFVNSNPSGTTFFLSKGVYRMQSVSPKNNNTFLGEPGTVLNGSRVLTNWSSAGSGQYYVGNQTQQYDLYGSCARLSGGERDARCQRAESVFVDGVWLTQVLSRSEVNSSTFYFDYDRDRIYIGQNPSGKLIEASVSDRAFSSSASGVTISGLVVEKYSNRAQTGAIHMSSGWTVSNVESRLNHGYGIRIANNTRVLNSFVHHNGQLGIGGVGQGVLIQGNEVSYNNLAGFLMTWEAAGMKFAVTRDIVIRDNYVHRNNGRGIWTDINVVNAVIENNRTEWNAFEGIVHELSYDAIIRNNISRFNGLTTWVQLWGSQILIQNSSNVEVYGNEVWVAPEGGDGIGMIEQNRGGGDLGPWVSRNNKVYDNEIHHQSTAGDNGLAGGCSSGNGNRWDSNTYYAPARWFEVGRFEACGPKQNWDGFRALGWEKNGVAIVTD